MSRRDTVALPTGRRFCWLTTRGGQEITGHLYPHARVVIEAKRHQIDQDNQQQPVTVTMGDARCAP
jgi:hypothetical protein